ncbi:MAG: hypothetical protein WD066_03765 [Planctomycetaceae bacterium]
MRSIMTICAAAALCCCVSAASGQESYDGWKAIPTPPRTWTPEEEQLRADSLMHARAAEEARNRSARIEARKWLGISTARPLYRHDSMLLRPYSPYWAPYYAPAPRVIFID